MKSEGDFLKEPYHYKLPSLKTGDPLREGRLILQVRDSGTMKPILIRFFFSVTTNNLICFVQERETTF